MTHTFTRSIFCPLCILLLLLIGTTTATAQQPDTLDIFSNGVRMSGFFYATDTEVPAPTLLLVPGWPTGTNDVLGMAKRTVQQGLNILVINPRGTENSDGTFSFLNALDDIGVAFDWLHKPDNIEQYKIDTTQIAIGGHSFGGITIAYAARDPRVRRIIGFAPTDHALLMRLMDADPEYDTDIRAMVQSTVEPEGPVRVDEGGTWEFLQQHPEIIGFHENVEKLVDRSFLLFGGWIDTLTPVNEYILPFCKKLKDEGATDVTVHIYVDNHGFGDHREQLADVISEWMGR